MTVPLKVGQRSVFFGSNISVLLGSLMLTEEPDSFGSVTIFFVKVLTLEDSY